MAMAQKYLPLGIQDFETMRKGNFVYVDKTEYIHNLIQPLQAFYFMSLKIPIGTGKSIR